MLDLSSRKVYGALAEQCVGGDAKADKVETAVAGHLAGLDANGNLTDSGVSPTEEVTVEGNPVTFDSPFEQDAKNVVVSVKPIQAGSGTPSPENIRPISGIDEVEIGVSGKNLWNPNDTVNGFLDTDGSIRSYIGFSTTNYRECSANKTYTLSYYRTGVGDGNGMRIAWYDANKNFIRRDGDIEAQTVGLKQISATAPANAVYMRASMYTNVAYTENQQLEYGSSSTIYEPYNPNSHTTPIPLPSTLYDADVDVTEGKMRVTKVIYKVTSLNRNNDYSFFAGLPANTKGGQYYTSELLCDRTPIGANGGRNEVYVNDSGAFRLNTYNAFSTAEDALAYFGGEFNICYTLATPIELDITPAILELLEGTNVVTTNAEKVAVTYGRSLWQDIDDLKTDTEGKLNKSDVADVEGDTASRAYSVNEFMLRADGLYKVTQPIAQNASITSSNTTKTTIGANLVHTVEYTVNDVSALSWTTTSNGTKYAMLNTGNALPTGAKIVGIVACEPWSSGTGLKPSYALETSRRNIYMIEDADKIISAGKWSVLIQYVFE